MDIPTFTRDATFAALLDPAMQIAQARDHEAAEAFIEAYTTYLIDMWDHTPESAHETIQINLGYYAGYYDHATRVAVQEVFGAVHPVFGAVNPTPEQAFDAGQQAAMGIKWTPDGN